MSSFFFFQGQTLSKVLIDLGDVEFAAGLTYTALSRVRRLLDLVFYRMPEFRRIPNIKKSDGYILQRCAEIDAERRQRNTLSTGNATEDDRSDTNDPRGEIHSILLLF